MTSARDEFVLHPRIVFTADQEPLFDQAVVVKQGRIASVSCRSTGSRPSWGHDTSIAIIPPIVNVHTHLEFSGLERPVGQPGMQFVDWIREVIQWRRHRYESLPDARMQQRIDVADGWQQSLRAGVGYVGEIATMEWSNYTAAAPSLHGVVFRELLGWSADRQDELLRIADSHVQSTAQQPTCRTGISPHAPYTVTPELVSAMAERSRSDGFPVAMHLAESHEELELLRTGQGPIVELLRDANAWRDDVITGSSRPLDYLQRLSQSHHAVVVHGNYLNAMEIEFVALHRDRMTVAYCPRTHVFFGHDRYPLSQFLAQGARVALGTDSRASNPDLCLLAEVREAAAHHPDVSPRQLLAMATTIGANALGLAEDYGKMSVGSPADFTVVSLPDAFPKDPYEIVLDPNLRVLATFVQGQRMFTADNW